MTMFKNILWATDFSDESKAALRYADHLAAVFGARLTALHVVPDLSPILYELSGEGQADVMSKIENAKASGAAELEHVCRAEGICPAVSLIKEGRPAETIGRTAAEIKADLIVVGRQGAGAKGGALIGNVAHKLLRSAPVPILVVKGGAGQPPVKRILVPTDFTRGEEIERDYAWKLARTLGAGLTFLYVLEFYGHDLRLTDEMFSAALKKLTARRKREHADVEMTEKVVKAFDAAEGIVDFAEPAEFDLIVMSSVVKKLPRVFLGSTTEKVIMRSRVPVLAIPPRRD